jgi:hypothetical protein
MLNDSEAERLDKQLAPIYGIIREAILGGFRYRQKRYAEELPNHTARTRASLTNDLIVMDFMKRELKKFGVRVLRIHNRILFDVKGQLILHFKKLNRALLSSNLQTEFAYAFTRQRDLPGIPTRLPRIIAGYVPTPDWTGLEGVFVTWPNGNNVEWKRSLLEQAQKLTDLLEETDEQQRRDRKKQRRFRRKGDGGSPPSPSEGTGTHGDGG